MSALIGFVCGVTLCVWLAELPDWRWLLTSCLLWPLQRSGPLWWRRGCAGLLGIGLGLAWGVWQAGQRLAERLPGALDGQVVERVVTVRDLPVASTFGHRVLAELAPQADWPRRQAVRVRLQLGRGQPWPAGSRWRVRLRLQPYHATANGHGFDAEAWLWAQGMLVSARVVGRPQRLPDADDWQARVDRLRARVAQRTARVLAGQPREAALVTALTVGVQQEIAREDWTLFARTGVTHIVSISGLHVGMVAGLAAWLVRQGLRRWPWPGRTPRLWVALGGLLAAGAYSLLAGWSVPTRRTFFMLAVACLLLCWRRALTPMHIWWLALAAVLLLDPFAVYFPGLWLSFGLVAALMTVTLGRRQPPDKWQAMLAAQWAATVMSVVPLVGFFSALPLVSPLANGFAIPWVSLLVSPLCLLAAAIPLDALLWLCAWLCRVFYLVMGWCAAVPVWWVAAPSWPQLLAGGLGALWLIAPLGWAARLLGSLLLIPLLCHVPARPAAGQLRATVLDVGQGLAVWLQTARHDLLYDTGVAASEAVLVANLRGSGVRRLDALMLSHHDADHDGAAPALLANMPVQQLWLGQAASAQGLGQGFALCRPGRRWQWDGVRFEVLWPTADWHEDGNNPHSCVLRVVTRHGSLLLTGDIPQSVETQLLTRQRAMLASTVLIVPHHGSKTSSSMAFLQAVAPRWAVMSVGWRNRYGHPHPTVLARYQSAGVQVLRTDELGALTLLFGPRPVVSGWRQQAPRHWRSGPPVVAGQSRR
ncbi:DNA internalization-related competence protein ComEC/Rec2 [Paludibacterium sp. B53371]|uniref:DNA internalization-related competence protein ComEC/Rec2 n=1 Tax=Paludibacterium sp. B53371 TaxID=2806263 RepID=UPI001C03A4F3|nr:DNA internalization-related competence protein ComEC/Rec2 [Paludibacterium sp. B53371]